MSWPPPTPELGPAPRRPPASADQGWVRPGAGQPASRELGTRPRHWSRLGLDRSEGMPWASPATKHGVATQPRTSTRHCNSKHHEIIDKGLATRFMEQLKKTHQHSTCTAAPAHEHAHALQPQQRRTYRAGRVRVGRAGPGAGHQPGEGREAGRQGLAPARAGAAGTVVGSQEGAARGDVGCYCLLVPGRRCEPAPKPAPWM